MVFNFNVHAVVLMNPDKMHICLSIKLFFQIVIMALFSISEFIIQYLKYQNSFNQISNLKKRNLLVSKINFIYPFKKYLWLDLTQQKGLTIDL